MLRALRLWFAFGLAFVLASCTAEVSEFEADASEFGSIESAVISGNGSVNREATVMGNATANNNGGFSQICVGRAPPGLRRGFVQYDLPSIPAGSTITRVRLSVSQSRIRAVTGGSGTAQSATLRLRRVTGSWTEGSGTGGSFACGNGANVAGVDWSNQPAVSSTTSGLETLNTTVGSTATFDTNVGTNDDQMITDVQNWLDGTSTNRGWRFEVSEASTATNARLLTLGTFTVYWTVPNGETCDSDNDCNSNRCVATDGSNCGGASGCVCCNASTCGGECESCHLGGSVGTCTDRSSGTDCGTGPSCTGSTATIQAECTGSSGTCPAESTVSCSPYQCGSTACRTSCSIDSHCVSGFHCDGGSCEADLSNGTACSSNNQCSSNQCTDGVCCNSSCTGQCQACDNSGSVGTCTPTTGAPRGSRTACATDGSSCGGTCNGVLTSACTYPTSGCRSASCTAGTATLAANCDGAGACPGITTDMCSPYLCSGSACGGSCTTSAQCATGFFCSGGVCTGSLPLGSACGSDGSCDSGNCVDGFCCNSGCTGQCEACDVTGREGQCRAISGAPHGTRTACDSDGSSCGGSCNGSNRTACQYPSTSTVCRNASCFGDVETLQATCDGSGACNPRVNNDCDPYICGPTACENDCDDDSGCQTGFYCVSNRCETGRPNGSSCTTTEECTSGNCTDGVCCNSSCGGQCEACDLSGSVGLCSAVNGDPRGSRPACDGDGSVCDGSCNGSTRSACTYPGAGTSCRDASCAAGTETQPASCDGAGACPDVSTEECTPYLCGATRCETSCSEDDDCIVGLYCVSGTCLPGRPNGDSCTTTAECTSGNCADGVCCDGTCAGQCEACNLAGLAGSCTAVSGDPVGERDACDTDGSTCGGECNGTRRTTCTYPSDTSTCGAASCAAGVGTLAALCDGGGSCRDAETVTCAPYMCMGNACATACTDDGDCNRGNYCNGGGMCAPVQANGGSCVRDEECLSETCVDGVCCNSICTGQCEACDVAGSAGTCIPVVGAPRGGRDACASDGTVCGGACDGVDPEFCIFPVEDTACGSDATCDGGSAATGQVCGGAGACAPPTVVSCSPFLCDGDACGITCTDDEDCVASGFCDGGICAPAADLGTSCETDAGCSSGECVDGVCCDRACEGQCEACDIEGVVGTCGLVEGDPHGDRAACDSDGSLCGGTCDGVDVTCAFPDETVGCLDAACVDSVLSTASSCDGTGACAAPLEMTCEDGCAEEGAMCAEPMMDAGMPDAGTDAGMDAGSDAGTDAGTDAGSDAGDSGVDAGTDSATPDATSETGAEAGADAGEGAPSGGGCSVGAQSQPEPWAPISLALALAALVARRRR